MEKEAKKLGISSRLLKLVRRKEAYIKKRKQMQEKDG